MPDEERLDVDSDQDADAGHQKEHELDVKELMAAVQVGGQFPGNSHGREYVLPPRQTTRTDVYQLTRWNGLVKKLFREEQ